MAGPYLADGSVGPTGGCASITPSAVTTYTPNNLRFLNVAVAGTVAVVYEDGSSGAPYLSAGVIHPIGMVKQVLAAGTSATGITGWTA